MHTETHHRVDELRALVLELDGDGVVDEEVEVLSGEV